MICVYPADCTDSSTNGNGTIEPTSALVTETLNGEYELQLVHGNTEYSADRSSGFLSSALSIAFDIWDNDDSDKNYMKDAETHIPGTHPYVRPWQKSDTALLRGALFSVGQSSDGLPRIHHHIQQK